MNVICNRCSRTWNTEDQAPGKGRPMKDTGFCMSCIKPVVLGAWFENTLCGKVQHLFCPVCGTTDVIPDKLIPALKKWVNQKERK